MLQGAIDELLRRRWSGDPRGHARYQHTIILPPVAGARRKQPEDKVPHGIVSSIAQGSGAVSAMAASGSRVIVGACCSQQPEYNREGELQLITYADYPHTAIASSRLDGHYWDGGRRTVTSVKCTHDRRFYSAGYDGRVCLWTLDDGQLSMQSHVSAKAVLDVCPGPGGVFYGTAAGQLGFLSSTDVATEISSLPVSSRAGVNWIDSVVYDAGTRTVHAAIGYHQSSKAGVLECWDVETRTLTTRVVLSDGNGLSAVDSTARDGGRGGLIALAPGNVLVDRVLSSNGLVRVYSDGLQKVNSISVQTSHLDIDAVRLSRDGRLLAVGDAHDHRFSLYDLCNPSRPLITGRCASGPPCDEVFSLSAFTPDNHILLGGHDAFVYSVDAAEGRTRRVGLMASSVTCIQLLDDHPHLLAAVGSEGGAVQFLGY